MTPPPPLIWCFLCRERLGLSEHLTRLWWQALGKSAWSHCQELRAGMVPPEQAHGKHAVYQQLLDRLLAPTHLMEVVEGLIRQQLLLRRDAAVIEDAICRLLEKQGTWRRTPQGVHHE